MSPVASRSIRRPRITARTRVARSGRPMLLRPPSSGPSQSVVATRRKSGHSCCSELSPQLAEHAQIRAPVRAGHRGPGRGQGHDVRLAGTHPQETTEHVDLPLAGPPEHRAQQRIASAEVVDQHAGRSTGRPDERLESVREPVGEGEIRAVVEQLLLDVRLRSSSHTDSFTVTMTTSTVDRERSRDGRGGRR